MLNLIVTILIILVIVSIVYLAIYLFQKYVHPIDARITNIIIFIIAVLLVIYAISGHSFSLR